MRPEDFRQFCIALVAAVVGFCAVFLWVWAMAAAYEFLFGTYGYEVAFWGTFLMLAIVPICFFAGIIPIIERKDRRNLRQIERDCGLPKGSV